MKTIALQKLTLKDFQGGNFVFAPDGDDTSVYAANGAGKTRLASAFSWLLFGKDSMGRSDFEIKNLDSEGERAHGLEHTVEGFLSVDGTPIILKRTYHEIWTKKRGTAQSTLTGNTTDYWIDGVPAQLNEYKSYISEIMGDEERVKLLTSPTAFPALPWQRQRSLLLEVCGDITDAQVIATDESLAPLTELLKRYTVSKTPLDDLRKVVMGRRTEINKNIDQLPIRIDEVFRGLPDITGLFLGEIKGSIGALETSINEAKLTLQGVDNGSTIADLSKKLAVVNADINKLENEYYEDGMKTVRRIGQQINDIKDGVSRNQRNNADKIDRIKTLKDRITIIDTQIETLRQRWFDIDEETFRDTTEDTCPACGQSLPSDRVEEARDKARAAFNMVKADKLFKIETDGKELASEKEKAIKEVESLILIEVNAREDEITALNIQYDAVKAAATDYSIIPGHAELVERKKEIEIGIEAEKESIAPQKEIISEKINKLEELLRASKADLNKFTERGKGEKRVNELKAEEKTLAKEFEDLERQLFLIESFIKRKVSLLNERINARFNLVRFKLFNQNINGSVEDCCEITVNGVPFGGGLNSAARTQAGCEIVSVLQEHYGIAPVIFVDNRESCTLIPEMQCQVISLYVSPEDKVLRIEAARKERRAVA